MRNVFRITANDGRMFQVCHYELVKLQKTPTANLNIRRVIGSGFINSY
jgi:hypothetical protein